MLVEVVRTPAAIRKESMRRRSYLRSEKPWDIQCESLILAVDIQDGNRKKFLFERYGAWYSEQESHTGVMGLQIAWAVNKALDKEFPNREEVEVIAEPGRYFSMAAFTLATNVIARNAVTGKDITDKGDKRPHYHKCQSISK